MNILDVLEGKEVVYFSFRLSYCDYILATQVHSRPYTCHHIITLFYMKCYETRLIRTINVHEFLICMVPHSLFIYVSGACKCHLPRRRLHSLLLSRNFSIHERSTCVFDMSKPCSSFFHQKFRSLKLNGKAWQWCSRCGAAQLFRLRTFLVCLIAVADTTCVTCGAWFDRHYTWGEMIRYEKETYSAIFRNTLFRAQRTMHAYAVCMLKCIAGQKITKM
jgi:hypothetical protein